MPQPFQRQPRVVFGKVLNRIGRAVEQTLPFLQLRTQGKAMKVEPVRQTACQAIEAEMFTDRRGFSLSEAGDGGAWMIGKMTADHIAAVAYVRNKKQARVLDPARRQHHHARLNGRAHAVERTEVEREHPASCFIRVDAGNRGVGENFDIGRVDLAHFLAEAKRLRPVARLAELPEEGTQQRTVNAQIRRWRMQAAIKLLVIKVRAEVEQGCCAIERVGQTLARHWPTGSRYPVPLGEVDLVEGRALAHPGMAAAAEGPV